MHLAILFFFFLNSVFASCNFDLFSCIYEFTVHLIILIKSYNSDIFLRILKLPFRNLTFLQKCKLCLTILNCISQEKKRKVRLCGKKSEL